MQIEDANLQAKIDEYSLLRGMKLNPINKDACLRSIRKMMKPLQRNLRVKRVLEMEYLSRDMKHAQIKKNKAVLSDVEKRILRYKKLMAKGKHTNDLTAAQDILASMTRNIGKGTGVMADDASGATMYFPDGTEFPFSNLDEQIRIENRITEYLFNVDKIDEINKTDIDKDREVNKLKNKITQIAIQGDWFGKLSVLGRRQNAKGSPTALNKVKNKNDSLFQIRKTSTFSKLKPQPAQTYLNDSASIDEGNVKKNWNISLGKIMDENNPRLDSLIEAEEMVKEYFATEDITQGYRANTRLKALSKISQAPLFLILPASIKGSALSKSPPKTPSHIDPSHAFASRRLTLPGIESPSTVDRLQASSRWHRLRSVRYAADSSYQKPGGSPSSDTGLAHGRNGIEKYEAVSSPKTMRQIGSIERKYFKRKMGESEAAKMAFMVERCRLEVIDNPEMFGELFSKKFKTDDLSDNKITFKITKKVFLNRNLRASRSNVNTLSSLAKKANE